MQNSRIAYAPRPTPTLPNSILLLAFEELILKVKAKSKKLFAALKAVTRTAEKGGTC
jgi:hypothetical protein